MRREYNYRRRYIVDGFRAMGLSCFEPLGAFYVFPCIKSTGMTSEEFCQNLLMEEKVAVVPGNAFGESERDLYVVHMRIRLRTFKKHLKE